MYMHSSNHIKLHF